MASQFVTEGTCKPTKYSLIYNSTGLADNDLKTLTYWQTFNYYNWCGPVKIPAVTQYAHKLAYYIGEHLVRDVREGGLKFTELQ